MRVSIKPCFSASAASLLRTTYYSHCILLRTAYYYALHTTAHCILLRTAYYCALHTTTHCILLRTAYYCALHTTTHCILLTSTHFIHLARQPTPLLISKKYTQSTSPTPVQTRSPARTRLTSCLKEVTAMTAARMPPAVMMVCSGRLFRTA